MKNNIRALFLVLLMTLALSGVSQHRRIISSTGGDSENSLSLSVPTAPLSLFTAVISDTQINLSWTTPQSNGGSVIIGYRLERESPVGGGWSTAANLGVVNSFNDTGRTASTQYNYRLVSINSIGESPFSNTSNATTSPGGGTAATGAGPGIVGFGENAQGARWDGNAVTKFEPTTAAEWETALEHIGNKVIVPGATGAFNIDKVRIQSEGTTILVMDYPVMLYGGEIQIERGEFIMMGLTILGGNDFGNTPGASGEDIIEIGTNSVGHITNLAFYKNTFGWFTDGCADIIAGDFDVSNVSFQENMLIEGLDGHNNMATTNSKNPPDSGFVQNITYYRNAFMQGRVRMPRVALNATLMEVIQNTMYAWHSRASDVDAGSVANFVGNYYKSAPETSNPDQCIQPTPGMDLYMWGNFGGDRDEDSDPQNFILEIQDRGTQTQSATPTFGGTFGDYTALLHGDDIESLVVDNSGAWFKSSVQESVIDDYWQDNGRNTYLTDTSFPPYPTGDYPSNVIDHTSLFLIWADTAGFAGQNDWETNWDDLVVHDGGGAYPDREGFLIEHYMWGMTGVIPTNPNPVWTEGFETHTPINDPASAPWRTSGTHFQVVVTNDADSSKSGTKALRSHVPTSGGGTYRSEVLAKNYLADDGINVILSPQTIFTTRTFGYSFMIPTSVTFDSGDEHVFTQWKNSNFSGTPDAGEPGSPALDFRLDDDLLKVIWKHSEDNPHTGADSTNSQTLINPITKGSWYDIVIEINYDYRRISNGGNGHLKIWVGAADTEIDPVTDLVVDFYGAIGYDDTTGHYWKFGIYPGTAPGTALVAYFDDTFIMDGAWLSGGSCCGGEPPTFTMEEYFDSWTADVPNGGWIVGGESGGNIVTQSGTDTLLITRAGGNPTLTLNSILANSTTYLYEVDSKVTSSSLRINAGSTIIHSSNFSGISGGEFTTGSSGDQDVQIKVNADGTVQVNYLKIWVKP